MFAPGRGLFLASRAGAVRKDVRSFRRINYSTGSLDTETVAREPFSATQLRLPKPPRFSCSHSRRPGQFSGESVYRSLSGGFFGVCPRASANASAAFMAFPHIRAANSTTAFDKTVSNHLVKRGDQVIARLRLSPLSQRRPARHAHRRNAQRRQCVARDVPESLAARSVASLSSPLPWYSADRQARWARTPTVEALRRRCGSQPGRA